MSDALFVCLFVRQVAFTDTVCRHSSAFATETGEAFCATKTSTTAALMSHVSTRAAVRTSLPTTTGMIELYNDRITNHFFVFTSPDAFVRKDSLG